jgi:hypothetical protein
LVFTNAFDEIGIKYIDFKSYFEGIKAKKPFNLFPKYGIHWSTYGTAIAADSILSYLDSVSMFEIPKLDWEAYPLTDSLDYAVYAYDVGKGMNLLFRIKQPNLSYVNFNFGSSSEITEKPVVLAVGDSYYKNLQGTKVPDYFFKDHEFWFYNIELYPRPASGTYKVDEFNLKEKIIGKDIIILISTDANLYKFPFGFADDLYEIFRPDDSAFLLNYCKFVLKNDWALQNELAVSNYRIIDSLFDCINSKIKRDIIEMQKRRIRNNPNSFETVLEKAQLNKRSILKQIDMDALWLYNNQIK